VSGTTTVVVGGTAGIGRGVAEHYAGLGDRVVLTGRDAGRARTVAAAVGGDTLGLAVDLAEPETIAAALAGVGPVDRLVVAALERDHNRVADYDIARARRLATLKVVGYAEVVHTLLPRLGPEAAVVLFGGLAARRPWPGSLTVSSVNGAVSGLVRALAVEVAPIRVNGIHPGVVGDSPAVLSGWTDAARQAVVDRTPTGRLAEMRDVVGAAVFLLENRGVNGIDLEIDGGWLVR
jgi:NAD(P)-dependent dehydrogenase (short-subunit alcohol dehydrogenase family)